MAVIQPTERLAIRVHIDMVSTSFGLKQPANKHGRCSPSKVTLSHHDCQTYLMCQTIVQAYLYYALLLSRHQQVWRSFQTLQLLLSGEDINNRDFCSMQSDDCVLCSKQLYYLSKRRLFPDITRGKFCVTVTVETKNISMQKPVSN